MGRSLPDQTRPSGLSSPFEHRELLWELIRGRYEKSHTLIDLADVKGYRFYDLLALYEKADALITTDSAPLHLARGVPRCPCLVINVSSRLLTLTHAE